MRRWYVYRPAVAVAILVAACQGNLTLSASPGSSATASQPSAEASAAVGSESIPQAGWDRSGLFRTMNTTRLAIAAAGAAS